MSIPKVIAKMLGLEWDDSSQKSEEFYIEGMLPELELYRLKHDINTGEFYLMRGFNWGENWFRFGKPSLEDILGGKVKITKDRNNPNLLIL